MDKATYAVAMLIYVEVDISGVLVRWQLALSANSRQICVERDSQETVAFITNEDFSTLKELHDWLDAGENFEPLTFLNCVWRR